MLILCDFDGTVTERDTNSFLSRRFSPDAFDAWEGKLAGRDASLRDVLAAELGGMTAGHDVIVSTAVEEIPLRAGFASFLDDAADHGDEVVLLSAGFRQIIEPMLHHAGVGDRVQLIANDVRFTASGGVITWRDLPVCAMCGEPCKRGDVERLSRARARERVVFIGDGYSDRCGAEAADEIISRAFLSTYLADRNVPFHAFDDFHDVARILGELRR